MVTVQQETKISYFKIRKSPEYFSLSMCVPMLPVENSTAAPLAGLSLLEHSGQTLLKGWFGHVETFPRVLVGSLHSLAQVSSGICQPLTYRMFSELGEIGNAKKACLRASLPLTPKAKIDPGVRDRSVQSNKHYKQ